MVVVVVELDARVDFGKSTTSDGMTSSGGDARRGGSADSSSSMAIGHQK